MGGQDERQPRGVLPTPKSDVIVNLKNEKQPKTGDIFLTCLGLRKKQKVLKVIKLNS